MTTSFDFTADQVTTTKVPFSIDINDDGSFSLSINGEVYSVEADAAKAIAGAITGDIQGEGRTPVAGTPTDDGSVPDVDPTVPEDATPADSTPADSGDSSTTSTDGPTDATPTDGPQTETPIADSISGLTQASQAE